MSSGWLGTEASSQQLWVGAILKSNGPALGKPADDNNPSQHLDCNLTRDHRATQKHPARPPTGPWFSETTETLIVCCFNPPSLRASSYSSRHPVYFLSPIFFTYKLRVILKMNWSQRKVEEAPPVVWPISISSFPPSPGGLEVMTAGRPD